MSDEIAGRLIYTWKITYLKSEDGVLTRNTCCNHGFTIYDAYRFTMINLNKSKQNSTRPVEYFIESIELLDEIMV